MILTSTAFRGVALIRGETLIKGRRLFKCGYPNEYSAFTYVFNGITL